MNIYVANLDFTVRDGDLQKLFEAYGEVSSVKIVTDRNTGRSRGFGFIEMPSNEAGNEAIEGLNGRDVKGRAIVVKLSEPRAKDFQPRSGGDRDRRFQSRERRYWLDFGLHGFYH